MGAFDESEIGLTGGFKKYLLLHGSHPAFGADFIGHIGKVGSADAVAAVPTGAFRI